jgi:hypothetical protein
VNAAGYLRAARDEDDRRHGLELVQTVATPKVTHLKFARR